MEAELHKNFYPPVPTPFPRHSSSHLHRSSFLLISPRFLYFSFIHRRFFRTRATLKHLHIFITDERVDERETSESISPRLALLRDIAKYRGRQIFHASASGGGQQPLVSSKPPWSRKVEELVGPRTFLRCRIRGETRVNRLRLLKFPAKCRGRRRISMEPRLIRADYAALRDTILISC